MRLTEDRFNFTNNYNDEVKGNILYPEGSVNLPLVIILHGFKGWKDWGFLPYFSESLAQSEAITIRFDFSLNGMDEGGDLVAFPEKFAANTVSREVSDIIELVSRFKDGTLVESESYEDIWNGKIVLVGHSLGGAVAILSTEFIKIDALVLLASISRFARYTERQKKFWRKDGYVNFINNRTGQELSINLSYLEDIENNDYNVKLLNALRKYSQPVLILHGSEDLTVPVAEAEELAEAGKNNMNLSLDIIEKTGHTFGIEHPFLKTSDALERIIKQTKTFIGLQ